MSTSNSNGVGWARRMLILPEIAVYASLCLFPLVLTLLGHDGGTAEGELREVTPPPVRPTSLAQWKAWPPKFEQFVNDRFAGRPFLIWLNSRARYALGDSGNTKVAVGKQGWLFLSTNEDALDRHRGIKKFTESQLDLWVRKFLEHQDWLHQQGIQTLFVIVPNKHTIYSEFLPSRYTVRGPTPTDQLVQALEDRGFTDLLDLRPILLASKPSMQSYFKLDSHWNDQGSFLAYQSIAEVLARKLPHLHRVAPEDIVFKEAEDPGGIAQMLGLEKELRESTQFAKVLHSAVTGKSGDHYRKTGIRIKTSRARAPKAVVFCDSFTATSLIKYLQESFSELFYEVHWGWDFKKFKGWDYNKDFIVAEHPDVVVFAVAERLIPIPP